MSLMMRFRAPARDRKADETRHHDIRRKVKDAIDAIDKESAGLARRLEHARDHAASAIGNLDATFDEREPSVEQELVAAERQMSVANSRIAALVVQRRKYELVLRVLDGVDINGRFVGSLDTTD